MRVRVRVRVRMGMGMGMGMMAVVVTMEMLRLVKLAHGYWNGYWDMIVISILHHMLFVLAKSMYVGR